MTKHDEFEKIYNTYRAKVRESNNACLDEHLGALREFNAVARAAKTTQCSQYDMEKMREHFETNEIRMREAWEKRDARQNALNDELTRKCQAIGV